MRTLTLMLVLAAATPAFAQNATKGTEAPKATKAEVDQVVTSIKGDPNKLQNFCKIVTLQSSYQQAEEQKNEQKLKELDNQIEEAAKVLGPQYEKVVSSELDDASAKSLDDLSSTCKT